MRRRHCPGRMPAGWPAAEERRGSCSALPRFVRPVPCTRAHRALPCRPQEVPLDPLSPPEKPKGKPPARQPCAAPAAQHPGSRAAAAKLMAPAAVSAPLPESTRTVPREGTSSVSTLLPLVSAAASPCPACSPAGLALPRLHTICDLPALTAPAPHCLCSTVPPPQAAAAQHSPRQAEAAAAALAAVPTAARPLPWAAGLPTPRLAHSLPLLATGPSRRPARRGRRDRRQRRSRHSAARRARRRAPLAAAAGWQGAIPSRWRR